MDEPTCEICGSSRDQDIMAHCVHCDAYLHCYCLQTVRYNIPDEWYCDKCQNKGNGDPEPSKGGQTELQRQLHGCDRAMGRKTPMLDNNHRAAHQIGFKTLSKDRNVKVKVISIEEAALLESPQRSKSNVIARRTYSPVHPASPPKVKQSSTMKCKSTSRSDTQVPTLKRSAAASQNLAPIRDINMKRKAQSGGRTSTSTSREDKRIIGPQIQDGIREKKLVSEDGGRINSQTQGGTRESSDFNDSGEVFLSSMVQPLSSVNIKLTSHRKYHPTLLKLPRRCPMIYCWRCCLDLMTGQRVFGLDLQLMKTLHCFSSLNLMNLIVMKRSILSWGPTAILS